MIEKIFLVGGKMFDILVENAEKLGHGFSDPRRDIINGTAYYVSRRSVFII